MHSRKTHKSLKNTEADFIKLRNFLKVTVLVNQDLNLGCPMPKSTVTFGIILVKKKKNPLDSRNQNPISGCPELEGWGGGGEDVKTAIDMGGRGVVWGEL